MSVLMKLGYFTGDNTFPFFIQYGSHEENLVVHRHDGYSELVVILSGNVTHIVADERIETRKGDVFVINENMAHGYESPHDLQICNIMFDPGFFFSGDLDILKSTGFHALFKIGPSMLREQYFRNSLHLNAKDFETVSEMISFMVGEYNSEHVCRKTMLSSCFTLLAAMLSQLYDFAADKEDESNSIYHIANAVAYMENNFTEPIRISQLAEMTHFSERHFLRIFRAAYNMTPIDYIIMLRMKYAKTLLRDTDMAISEIATRSGFNNSNYFTNRFRRIFGTAPSHYRRA
jgi:AraC-like DNA-binding protein